MPTAYSERIITVTTCAHMIIACTQMVILYTHVMTVYTDVTTHTHMITMHTHDNEALKQTQIYIYMDITVKDICSMIMHVLHMTIYIHTMRHKQMTHPKMEIHTYDYKTDLKLTHILTHGLVTIPAHQTKRQSPHIGQYQHVQ